MRNFATILALLLVAGCAASPESIIPAYVSEVPYERWSCAQLSDEQVRLESALAISSSQQSSARTGDTVGVLLLGLPVSSMTGGNIAPQIALYKGQQEAVRKASLLKPCGIEAPMPTDPHE